MSCRIDLDDENELIFEFTTIRLEQIGDLLSNIDREIVAAAFPELSKAELDMAELYNQLKEI